VYQFQKLQFRPGIVRDLTNYANTGGWWDCDRVRFRNGLPEKIGGWSPFTDDTFEGTCRLILRHRINSGSVYTLICTTTHVYLEDGGTLNDITPWTEKDEALSSPFTTTDTSSDVEVTKSNHGRAVGDRIEIENADAVGGIAADDLNGERTISEIVDINTYKFTSGGTATSSTTGGGSNVTIYYILKSGLDSQVFGTGWGADPWGDGAWGEAGSVAIAGDATIRLWSADAYGEDLVMTPSSSNTEIFYWDASGGVSVRAVPLSTLSGVTNPPQKCSIVQVSEKDRHLISFGGDPYEDAGTADPLLIRWANQETAVEWTPSTTSTAGQLFVTGGTEIVAVAKTRQQYLVWTDDTLHSLTYIGGTYTYGIDLLANNTTIKGRNAAGVHLGVAYWMGDRGFYRFDGRVSEIDCPVEDYVFNDLDLSNSEKVFCSTNGLFNEIIWLYPSESGGTGEIDRYVMYNPVDRSWYYGSLVRTAWADTFLSDYPIAAGVDGYLYYHEYGNADGSTNPPSSLESYIESSPIEIGDGYHMMQVDWVLPDVTFRDSGASSPSVLMTLSTRDYPGEANYDSGTGSTVRSASAPVETFTKELGIRIRGRMLTVKYEDNATLENAETAYRIGAPRIRLRTDGRR
jgi:hypothetical protein